MKSEIRAVYWLILALFILAGPVEDTMDGYNYATTLEKYILATIVQETPQDDDESSVHVAILDSPDNQLVTKLEICPETPCLDQCAQKTTRSRSAHQARAPNGEDHDS